VVLPFGVTLAEWPGMRHRCQRLLVLRVLIMCFVVVLIGGIGSVRGALIAALLVGLVDTWQGAAALMACWWLC
jgi:branched-subunit amino acid ABC-type transport system permease component